MTIEEKARAYDNVREKIAQRFGSNVAEEVFLESEMSEDERIRNRIIGYLKQDIEEHPERKERIEDMLVWLEKQGELRVNMIQWKGDNLKEVVEFTGKSPKFGEWFKTWEEYENYVHSHGNIFKLFCEDGGHYEVPIGAWIVKTPDGYNIASKAKYKQKIEQKLNDKVKPKFKVGDWVVYCNDDVDLITGIEENGYRINEGGYIPFCCENDIRLWDVAKDAKDGDVLSWDNNKCIALFKNIYDEDSFKSYGFVGHSSGVFEPREFYHDIEGAHPSTKEQRDLLFKKMKEAGYEWDDDKKELKKVSQRMVSAEAKEALYDKPDEKAYVLMSLDEAIEHCKKKSCGNNACALEHKQLEKWLTELKELKGKKPTWSKEDEEASSNILYILNQLKESTPHKEDKTACKCIDWLKSLKGRVQPQPKQEWSEEDKEHLKSVVFRTEVYGGYNMFGKVKEDFEWLKDLPNRIQLQPQQEWSEEDKKELNLAVYFLENAQKAAPDEFSGYKGLNQKDYQIVIDWLKSLKDRVQLYPKQEWSEEDEEFVHGLIRGLSAKRDIHGHTTFSSDGVDITKTIAWLKSLKERNTWKPSEEQMHYLSWIANIKLGDGVVEQEVSKHLNELYEDLKKLI